MFYYTSTNALYLLSSSVVMWMASEWKGESSPTKIRVRHCNFFNPSVMSCLLHTCLASSVCYNKKGNSSAQKRQLREQGHTRWLLEEILKHLCSASHPATVESKVASESTMTHFLCYISQLPRQEDVWRLLEKIKSLTLLQACTISDSGTTSLPRTSCQ